MNTDGGLGNFESLGGLKGLLYWPITTLWFHIQALTFLLFWRKFLNWVPPWATALLWALAGTLRTARISSDWRLQTWLYLPWVSTYMISRRLTDSGCQSMWSASACFPVIYMFTQVHPAREIPGWRLCQRSISNSWSLSWIASPLSTTNWYNRMITLKIDWLNLLFTLKYTKKN